MDAACAVGCYLLILKLRMALIVRGHALSRTLGAVNGSTGAYQTELKHYDRAEQRATRVFMRVMKQCRTCAATREVRHGE